MNIFRILLSYILLFFANTIYSQNNVLYKLPNEKVIYSFQTKNNKIMSLNIDTNLNYIVYRFGTKNKIELEYPKEKDKSSFDKFEYSHYFRPFQNGVDNRMSLNYIIFINENVKYIIYENDFEYLNSKNQSYTGIRIEEIDKNKTTDIRGKNRTKKGSLGFFSTERLLKTSDEIYD